VGTSVPRIRTSCKGRPFSFSSLSILLHPAARVSKIVASSPFKVSSDTKGKGKPETPIRPSPHRTSHGHKRQTWGRIRHTRSEAGLGRKVSSPLHAFSQLRKAQLIFHEYENEPKASSSVPGHFSVGQNHLRHSYFATAAGLYGMMSGSSQSTQTQIHAPARDARRLVG